MGLFYITIFLLARCGTHFTLSAFILFIFSSFFVGWSIDWFSNLFVICCIFDLTLFRVLVHSYLVIKVILIHFSSLQTLWINQWIHNKLQFCVSQVVFSISNLCIFLCIIITITNKTCWYIRLNKAWIYLSPFLSITQIFL